MEHQKVVCDLPEQEQTCAKCGSTMVQIREKFVRSELVIMLAQMYVVDYYAASYKCAHCEAQTGENYIRQAETPVSVMKKSMAAPSTVAYVMQEEEELLGVFPVAELEYKEDAPEPFKKDQRGVHNISETGRWKLTSSNETEDRIFDLDEEERIYLRCKEKLVWIGKELMQEVFKYQWPKLKLVRYWQMSYKCPACHKKGRRVIVRVSVPKPLLNHSLVAASVVAEIMYQKYVNAMPLYRQEAAWKQLGG